MEHIFYIFHQSIFPFQTFQTFSFIYAMDHKDQMREIGEFYFYIELERPCDHGCCNAPLLFKKL